MWVAGKPLKVKVADDRYEVRKIGEPVPEAPSWPHRVFESHKHLGWIRWVDKKPVQPVRRKRRRKVLDVADKG